MSGIGSVMPGLLSSSGAGAVRDPSSGDYFDASNRVTVYTAPGAFPPSTAVYSVVFRWGGVDVATVNTSYPASPVTSAVVGSYTYYSGAFKSGTGTVDLYGIYRVGP